MRNIAALCLIAVVLLSSCEKKFDDKGRLLVTFLESSTGEVKFSPMLRTDSASVQKFEVATYKFKGEPYTGAIASYNKDNKIAMEGFLKDGLADSTWTFYFASGGVQMKGNYKNGWDIGLWQSFYGYDKVKIEKLYDDKGYLLERREYFDNGRIKNFQNIHAPQYNDKERIVSYDRRGNLVSIYVEDSVKWEKDAQ